MLEAIRNRRSIRKFSDEEVPPEKLEALLRAAMQAPSARNLRPRHYLVVKDKESLKGIPEIHPHAAMVPGASAAILVCGDRHVQPENGYLVADCSAAVENILLEAVDQGLGAVWLGIHPREERVAGFAERFSLPSSILPIALVAVGFPGETKDFQDRFDPSRVHWESWGS